MIIARILERIQQLRGLNYECKFRKKNKREKRILKGGSAGETKRRIVIRFPAWEYIIRLTGVGSFLEQFCNFFLNHHLCN